MEQHYSLPDIEFVDAFESCKLNPQWFSHEAHLRLAYLYITGLGAKMAAHKLCEGIARFDKIFGSGDKFHRTITMASVGILNHFIGKSRTQDFRSLIQEYPVLVDDFRSLLYTHYSPKLINSPDGKNRYLLPDVLADEVFEEVM